jgi:hypothetical protein
MAYRHGFENAALFAGILAENSDPFRDTGGLTRHPATRVIALTVAPHGQLAAQARSVGIGVCVPKSAPYTALLDAVRAA